MHTSVTVTSCRRLGGGGDGDLLLLLAAPLPRVAVEPVRLAPCDVPCSVPVRDPRPAAPPFGVILAPRAPLARRRCSPRWVRWCRRTSCLDGVGVRPRGALRAAPPCIRRRVPRPPPHLRRRRRYGHELVGRQRGARRAGHGGHWRRLPLRGAQRAAAPHRARDVPVRGVARAVRRTAGQQGGDHARGQNRVHHTERAERAPQQRVAAARREARAGRRPRRRRDADLRGENGDGLARPGGVSVAVLPTRGGEVHQDHQRPERDRAAAGGPHSIARGGNAGVCVCGCFDREKQEVTVTEVCIPPRPPPSL
eukprot:gene655-biopygen4654